MQYRYAKFTATRYLQFAGEFGVMLKVNTMSKMEVEILGFFLLVVFVVFTWFYVYANQKSLNDPNDDSVLYTNEIINKAQLDPIGLYSLFIYRQSGGLYKEEKVCKYSHEALHEAVSTLSRANIEAVKILKNTNTELSVSRLYHNHRGSSEGKKVGGFTIKLVPNQTVESRLRILLSQKFTPEEIGLISISEQNGNYTYSTQSKEIAERLAIFSGSEIFETRA